MAISRRMRPFNNATTVCCFLLLVTFLATACFQGNGDMFALAAEQPHHHNIRGLLRRATSSSSTTEQRNGTCQDQVGYTKKKKRTGKKIPLCEWVKKRKKKNCNKYIRKKRKKVSIREYCECTCLGVPTKPPAPTEPPEDNTKISCPHGGSSPETDLVGASCVAGQQCGYRHVVSGCKASEYMCIPIVSCFCQPDLTFMCTIAFLPDASNCPGAQDRPPPPDWEDPPSNIGAPCDPEDPPPTNSQLIVT